MTIHDLHSFLDPSDIAELEETARRVVADDVLAAFAEFQRAGTIIAAIIGSRRAHLIAQNGSAVTLRDIDPDPVTTDLIVGAVNARTLSLISAEGGPDGYIVVVGTGHHPAGARRVALACADIDVSIPNTTP